MFRDIDINDIMMYKYIIMMRTQIYIPQNQLKFLKKIAFQEDISLSEAIRRIVGQQQTSQSKSKKSGINTGSWLLSLAKRAEKLKITGPADLANNLDQYLYGGRK